MTRSNIHILFAILGIMSMVFSCTYREPFDQETGQAPNVIIIFTDDMNFIDIGALGGKVLTPTIDKLYREGVQLTNFYDCSAVCSPSRYNLLTGRYASRSKSLQRQFPLSDPAFLRWNVDIEQGERTIAHVMKDHGYFTGMVGKYHNLQNERIQDNSPAYGKPEDPEVQHKIRANYKMLKDSVQLTSGFEYLECIYINNLHALALPPEMQFHNMEWITSGALDFIDLANKRPFFLYFATTLPHAPAPIESMYADPRITPAGMLEKAPIVQASRENVIERVKLANLPVNSAPYTWLDDAIAALIGKLEEKGKLENTIILFASDHGGNNAKMTCYQKGVRAPAFLYWKDHFPAGKKLDQITANIDFAPTIYDLCKIDNIEDEVIDGRSMLPLILNQKISWRSSLLLEITYSRGVIHNDWKYIAVRFPEKVQKMIETDTTNLYNQEGSMYSADLPGRKIRVRYHADQMYPGYFDRDQLYNLKNDPNEQNNLFNNAAFSLQADKMMSLLNDYLSDLPHSFGEFNIINHEE